MELSGKVLVLALCMGVALGESLKAEFVESQWQEFKATFGRTFGMTEDSLRKEIFRKSLEEIAEHNKRFDAGETTWTMGVNQFADMTEEEFKSHMGLKVPDTLTFHPRNILLLNQSYPDSINWVEKGAVTPVKNQGQCGSCWAFAAVGAMEGQHFIKSGKLVALSEQEYVDCVTGSSGCSGGYMDHAFEYASEHGAISEEKYPYEASDTNGCRMEGKPIVYKPNGYKFATTEEEIVSAVGNIGPITVGLDFTHLRNYKSGIFDTDLSCNRLGHALLVVGYGTENGVDYYLMKNSWAASWGDKGYFKMVRGKKLCRVTDYAVYPL